MRHMSFFMTTDAIRDQTKTVTRRFGWSFLKPGDRVRAVERAMGLKKGETMIPLAVIEVLSVMPEPLRRMLDVSTYGRNEVMKEGFPDLSPSAFVQMLCAHYGVTPDAQVNRIEFRYVEVP